MAFAAILLAGCGKRSVNTTTKFETATEAVKKMAAGWNLGNSLDAFRSDIKPGSPSDQYVLLSASQSLGGNTWIQTAMSIPCG